VATPRAGSGASALITGASSGIGLELAKLFARDGHDVVLVARRADKLKQLAAELGSAHRIRATVIPADLADPVVPEEIFRTLDAADIEVDVVVNNAGFGLVGPFLATDLATELRMIRVNVMALTQLTKLFLPRLLGRGGGRILNVASTAGFQPGPFMAVYYATKAYVISFSEALAEELRGTGVTVTCLCPGLTRTGFQEAARMDRVRLFKLPFVMDAARVARAGYDGVLKGKRMVIPGLVNKLMPLTVRFAPRSIVTRVVRLLNERAGG
jgi:uncharacterized protein